MKYCAKCGKEIHDDAVVCIYCGCSTEPVHVKKTPDPEHTKLMSFVNEAKNIYIFGILSIVLCLGIGIVFQIINMVKIDKFFDRQVKALKFPEFELTDSDDIAAYEDAKKKISLSYTLTGIGFFISFVLIAIIFGFGLVPALL